MSIYLLREREFITNNQEVYKFGCSATIRVRLSKYPKGSELIMVWNTFDYDHKDVETKVLKILKKRFSQRTDIGREYFSGSLRKIISEVNDYWTKYLLHPPKPIKKIKLEPISPELIELLNSKIATVPGLLINSVAELTCYQLYKNVWRQIDLEEFKDCLGPEFKTTLIRFALENQLDWNSLMNEYLIATYYKDIKMKAPDKHTCLVDDLKNLGVYLVDLKQMTLQKVFACAYYDHKYVFEAHTSLWYDCSLQRVISVLSSNMIKFVRHIITEQDGFNLYEGPEFDLVEQIVTCFGYSDALYRCETLPSQIPNKSVLVGKSEDIGTHPLLLPVLKYIADETSLSQQPDYFNSTYEINYMILGVLGHRINIRWIDEQQICSRELFLQLCRDVYDKRKDVLDVFTFLVTVPIITRDYLIRMLQTDTGGIIRQYLAMTGFSISKQQTILSNLYLY